MGAEVEDREKAKRDGALRWLLATAEQGALDRLGRMAMFPDQCRATPFKLPAAIGKPQAPGEGSGPL